VAEKSSKSPGKARGQGKARRKPSKVKDLPMGSRTARSVKGGSFTGNLNTGGNRYTIGGSVRNMNTV
jgi:hypothetical protein